MLDAPGRLSFDARGDRLAVEPDEIDAGRFEALVTAAAQESPQQAVVSLRSALALWQGTPFAGIEHPLLTDWAGRLADRRLDAVESRLAAELDRLLEVGTTGTIAAITGTAGVGTTALAVRWAHRVRDPARGTRRTRTGRRPPGGGRGHLPGTGHRPELSAEFILINTTGSWIRCGESRDELPPLGHVL